MCDLGRLSMAPRSSAAAQIQLPASSLKRDHRASRGDGLLVGQSVCSSISFSTAAASAPSLCVKLVKLAHGRQRMGTLTALVNLPSAIEHGLCPGIGVPQRTSTSPV